MIFSHEPNWFSFSDIINHNLIHFHYFYLFIFMSNRKYQLKNTSSYGDKSLYYMLEYYKFDGENLSCFQLI